MKNYRISISRLVKKLPPQKQYKCLFKIAIFLQLHVAHVAVGL
jgi:hypothetical protein